MSDPILALVRRHQSMREAVDPRLNVHFINERGENHVFSFADLDRAERFRAAQLRKGLTILDGRTMADVVAERGE